MTSFYSGVSDEILFQEFLLSLPTLLPTLPKSLFPSFIFVLSFLEMNRAITRAISCPDRSDVVHLLIANDPVILALSLINDESGWAKQLRYLP
ncbi:hypothetical protein Bpfe_019267 [Biomphalaria pfeifferi]|uniref:Uncharacterized protein n=1 Tax=Biomphalaria pfeifferi TaxID=112525 RepID=A0AAD8F5R7_BIOPF|nr:hypothetical protein Bpfe_019267 [Biomphalaria pfeifferi]